MILNLILVVDSYVAPDEGTTILIVGRFPLAGMVGAWVAMGTGLTARRVSFVGGAVGILAVLDSLLVAEMFLIILASYLVTMVGGAMVGLLGKSLRSLESDQLKRRPQFSILEIAGWTAIIASMLGLTVLLREHEFTIDLMFRLMLCGLHGAFAGIIRLPLYAVAGKSRSRWIGGAILSVVLFPFLE